MPIIVHIGPPKTATTTIQKALEYNNDNVLKDNNIQYIINSKCKKDIYEIFNWTKLEWRSKAPLKYLILNRYFKQYDDFIHFYRYLKRIYDRFSTRFSKIQILIRKIIDHMI